MYIFDEKNRQYLDACGGAAVSCLGYNHRAPLKAIRKQTRKIPYIHSGFFSSPVTERLADELVAFLPKSLSHMLFLSGGSEAVEAALKLARQYFVEIGEPKRKYFISRRQSYHGNTIGALSVGNNVARRQPYAPIMKPVHSIAPCYPYRDQLENESVEEYGLRVANELESKILELGAVNVIGFIAETVGGATAGVLPPVPGYLSRIRQICDQYGILLILDEVMCGTGRTGTFLSCEQDDVVPDIVTLAKGLGAGYQPIAATICSDKICQVVRGGSGALMNGHTYMGHAIASAAALAVLKTIKSQNLLQHVRNQGHELMKKLRESFLDHPNIGDIRGRGLLIGIEFVAEKETKKPFDPSLNFHAHFKRSCMQNGLMCYTGGGTIDGRRGDHVLLAPAYIMTEPTATEIINRFNQSLVDILLELENSPQVI